MKSSFLSSIFVHLRSWRVLIANHLPWILPLEHPLRGANIKDDNVERQLFCSYELPHTSLVHYHCFERHSEICMGQPLSV